ncbi:uncharacterized protein SCHCODRAFT_02082721 [Schizophyllum commune H4-8]|uniref:uncharacterized protein n=1 Tax=Schizophyllum commune (strain H4-8 / FGSC 9210) TaxID=578458 RepID=UPI00216072AB|nr:uncharacterized protein SCHCODRAFT_02082434 [Schizophyllum commune H4-8]XP_050197846.1 uncharacterized protein SCHCODRAFT_02082721 [Schizophyllum commune H4-8]KAI5886846.1 hypothetical protein SCHCODRAFT_02082434 [Schizophyllum commune H4-8]KAI5886854.1 hypothetical protein SCHCODRAFT_02082721 [Schizophyllum commune H4-8]
MRLDHSPLCVHTARCYVHTDHPTSRPYSTTRPPSCCLIPLLSTYDLRPSTRTRRDADCNDSNRWIPQRGLSRVTDICTIPLDTTRGDVYILVEIHT